MASEWENLLLKDFAKFLSGGTPSKMDARYWNGNIPWISAKSMIGNRYFDSDLRLTEEGLKKGSRLVPKDTILLLVRGSALHQKIPVGITTAAVAFNQDVKAIIPDKRFLPLFLLYSFESKFNELLGKVENTGIGAGKLDTEVLNKLCFLCPPLKEQEDIVSFIKSFDDKVELNRQMNATLESMAQALFKSWFVDFDPVLDKALAAGNPIPDELQSKAAARLALGDARKALPVEIQALFPSSFVLTEEMGWIPEGWEVVTLNSITTELKRGISPKYLETGGVQVVNQRCIRNHEINFNLCRRHDDVKKKIDNQYIKIGDVLINSTGVGTLGRVAQVSDLLEPAIVDSHITIVRVEEEQYLPYSFGQMIITKENIIEAMGEGSTGQTELSRKNLAELIVLKPNLKILEQSDKGIKGYIDKIGINNKQISILTKLRDTLLPKLLSGELRIPDAEKIATELL